MSHLASELLSLRDVSMNPQRIERDVPQLPATVYRCSIHLAQGCEKLDRERWMAVDRGQELTKLLPVGFRNLLMKR